MTKNLLIAKSNNLSLNLLPHMANQHGLIAGATGSGKTVTLQTLAEQFSHIGVPVFMADIKGDLSGLSQAGGNNKKVEARIQELGITDFEYQDNPTVFWDVYGKKGHPIRATISDMGPLLLSRMLNLNETQTGILTAVFMIADDNGWLLLNLKDLRAMLNYASENTHTFTAKYGRISASSVGAIQRKLLQLEHEGGESLFGEPMLNLDDLMTVDAQGHGTINILSADALYHTPRVYTSLLLWLLSELFENLPETGNLDKPKLVFFFDEAHLLFNNAPKVLLDKIEQVVRLIRSKAVGVYFVSQNPLDIPDAVLGQLGNRVQHALRAFTPRDQKAVKSAANTFRPNPKVNVETAITELGVGEALVSFLDEKGRPCPVEIAKIYPPASRIGPATQQECKRIILGSPFEGHYEALVDRKSAFEILEELEENNNQKVSIAEDDDSNPLINPSKREKPRNSRRQPQGVVETLTKSAARTLGNELGRQILRGLLGSIFGGRRR